MCVKESQKNSFAGSRRADDSEVAYVAFMKIEPVRRTGGCFKAFNGDPCLMEILPVLCEPEDGGSHEFADQLDALVCTVIKLIG